MRFRRLATNLILGLVAVLFVPLVLEAGLRIYARSFYPKLTVLDDKLGWRHATNVSRTVVNEWGEKAPVVLNPFGFRGSPRAMATSPDRRRVLVLGDSFTEGFQVGDAELFTARMEATDPSLEVINTGVGGWGTVQQYLFLLAEGLQFHPDLVVLMVFENDLSDNILACSPAFGPRPYARLEHERLQLVETLDPSDHEKYIVPVPLRNELNRVSYFYYFINSRIYQRIFSDEMTAMHEADKSRVDEQTRHRILGELIGKMAGLLELKGIGFLVVTIPNRDDTRRGRSETVEVVARLCAARNIEHLSLLGGLHAEASSGVQLYFPQDIHWTKEGHRVAATEVLQRLQSFPW